MPSAASLILRVGLAAYWFQDGLAKLLFAPAEGLASLHALGFADPGATLFVLGIGEIGLAAVVLLGLRTLFFAWLQMLTVLLGHGLVLAAAPQTVEDGAGWIAAVIPVITAAAALAVLGGGRYSVDGRRSWV